MSEIKIGVVGYGNWGKNHVRVLSELNHLGGVYDNLISSGKSNEKIKFYDSLDDLINNVDALIISSPATTHFKIAKKALETLDVLIEKPIAMKISDVLTLQNLEKETKNLNSSFNKPQKFDQQLKSNILKIYFVNKYNYWTSDRSITCMYNSSPCAQSGNNFDNFEIVKTHQEYFIIKLIKD